MTEVEFTSSPRRDVEEPLYLDSARSGAPNSRPAERVSGPATGSDRPLHLDLAREPRPRRRGVPLVVACALTFVLGAGAGVLVLQPPSVLRDTFATVLASAGTGDAKTAIPAAPKPAQEQGAVSASPSEAVPAPESLLAPAAIGDLPPAPEPVAEPPAKPQAAASKPRPQRAATPKKHSADARPARAHSKPKAPLDLDALEKSLQ
jgi:hypothetical protein